MTSRGDAGASRFDAGKLLLDFTHGAEWVAIAPPDRVLLGNLGILRLHVRGAAAAHPLHVYLRTHFMTFHQTVTVSAAAEEIEIHGPPGPGWQWMNGENDGRIHGPLRLGEVFAYRFPGPTGSVIALWSGDGDRIASTPLEGRHGTLVNAIGERTRWTAPDRD